MLSLFRFSLNDSILRFVAPAKEIIPTASEHSTQTHKSRQARKVFASLQTLNIPSTDTDFFGQFFLSQLSPFTQGDHVLSETRTMAAGFRFARRHSEILSKK